MKQSIGWLGMIALALSAVACGSDDESSSGSSGATVTVSGKVTEATTTNPRPPLEGVTVCALDLPAVACATTDAAGAFVLEGVPANTKGALTFAKDGYLTGVVPGTTEAEDLQLDTSIAPDDLAQAFAGIAGFDWPQSNSGVLAIDVYDGQGNFVEGATASLSPTEGVRGPVYLSDAALPDKSLSATSKSSVVYFQAPAGKASLTVQHPERSCALGGWGWSSTTATADVPVVAGASSFAVIVCE